MTRIGDLPHALAHFDRITAALEGKHLALFLDYDGTLSPIAARPELAVLATATRACLQSLARRCSLAIVTGRSVAVARDLVGVEGIAYAGDHGFDILLADGREWHFAEAAHHLQTLDVFERALRAAVETIPGALVERKRYSLSLHYRQVAPGDVARIEAAIGDLLERTPALRQTRGKKVIDLQPDISWHKGEAVLWLLKELDQGVATLPIYLGDDTTDEDAFRVLRDSGVGIVLDGEGRRSAAHYRLSDPEEVRVLLDRLLEFLKGRAP